MSVQVTISVSDEDAETLRRNPHMYLGDAMNVTYRVCGLVREALPYPVPVKGGTVEAKTARYSSGAREILWVGMDYVTLSPPLGSCIPPRTLAKDHFLAHFEVLS